MVQYIANYCHILKTLHQSQILILLFDSFAMSNLTTTEKIISITTKDWQIYFRIYSENLLNTLIDNWTNHKPIEIEQERWIPAFDVQEIKTEQKSDIIWFIFSRDNYKDLIKLYKKRLSEWKSWSNLDHFINIANMNNLLQ